MLKSNFKIIMITLILINCFSNALKSEPHQNTKSNKSKKTEVKIPIKHLSPKTDEFIIGLIKAIKNPRLVYKDGQVIFYPDPDTKNIETSMKVIAVIMIICTITVVLIPIALILLIIELCLWYDLSTKNERKRSLIAYITLDDTGIEIKNQKIFWDNIINISKEEITKYIDGLENSKKNIFHFYDKYLRCLFDLQDDDEDISTNFNTLMSLIYHYLEKADIKFTQNVQKTSISENTRYQPVYVYR